MNESTEEIIKLAVSEAKAGNKEVAKEILSEIICIPKYLAVHLFGFLQTH
jgi:hypothetical protein